MILGFTAVLICASNFKYNQALAPYSAIYDGVLLALSQL